MTEKIRNIAIAMATLIAAVAFAIPTVGDYMDDKRFEKARSECLREGDNAKAFGGYGYSLCMRYRGFDE